MSCPRVPFALPPSLPRIFSFLDVVSLGRAAQVSRRWHDLALHGSNWQRVDLFEFQMAIEVWTHTVLRDDTLSHIEINVVAYTMYVTFR